jgi:chromosome segregation ATPase
MPTLSDTLERCSTLADAMETLITSRSATEQRAQELEDKLALHQQLHSEKVAELEARHRILQDRAVSVSAWAEQHRIGTRKMEAKHSALQTKHNELAASHSELTERHAKLTEKHSELLKRHTDTAKKLTTLTEKHGAAAQKQLALINELSAAKTLSAQLQSRNSDLMRDLAALAELPTGGAKARWEQL